MVSNNRPKPEEPITPESEAVALLQAGNAAAQRAGGGTLNQS